MTSTSDSNVEGALTLGGDRHPFHVPHLITDPDELKSAVEVLLEEPEFVIDIETTKERPRSNSLLWVGLGGPGRVYLVPCGHPKGYLLEPAGRQKTAAFLLYDKDDPRGRTKLGKPSMRMIDHPKPAVFGPKIKQMFPDQVTQTIEPLLFSDRAKIGHNVKFDLQSLAKYYRGSFPPPPYHDTLLIRHLLQEDLDSYKLKDLVCDWFRIGYYPGGVDRRKWAQFYPNYGEQGIENFGIDQVARYLAKDVRYCWLMYRYFSQRLDSKGVRAAYDFEMSFYPVIMAMEHAGFPVDLSKRDEVREELVTRIGEVEDECYHIADGEFPLSHLDYKRWVLFGEGTRMHDPKGKQPLKTQKLRVLTRTKETRQPQVTQAVLEHYADKGVRIAELLLEWSTLEKLRGTFVGEPGHGDEEPTGIYRFLQDGLVHASFKQHGTVTGRLSAAEPNLQQLPKRSKIREMFIGGPGNTLIVADYDQIELRCAGYLCQDPTMIRVFKEGQDIHRRAAAGMYQIALEDVTPLMRDVGKTQNFGTLYGAGEEKIAAVAGVSKRTALSFIRNYYEEFAELEPWKAYELRRARERGDEANPISAPPYVEIPPVGRRRRLPDLYNQMDNWRRWRAERQAINALVQGFAAYIMKVAMLNLYSPLQRYPAQLLAQVHDEIIVQTEEDTVDEVRDLISRSLGGVLDHQGQPILGEIPLVVSIGVGSSWAAAKS